MSSESPQSPAEQALRAQLAELDAQNAPIIAATDAGITAAQNNITGSNAAWNLTIDSDVTSFTLTLLDGSAATFLTAGLTASAIGTALESSASDLAGNVSVIANSDGSYSIELTDALANTPEPADVLTGSTTVGTLTITQTNPGNAPAGSDQNANIAAAQSSFDSALAQAQTAMSTISSSLSTASTETAAAAGPTSVASLITALGLAVPEASSIPPGDVLASDLNPKLASFTDALVNVLNAIDDQLSGSAATAITHLKNAANALQTVGQQFYNQVQPGDEDTEAQKSADLAFIQSLLD